MKIKKSILTGSGKVKEWKLFQFIFFCTRNEHNSFLSLKTLSAWLYNWNVNKAWCWNYLKVVDKISWNFKNKSKVYKYICYDLNIKFDFQRDVIYVIKNKQKYGVR